ncbi:Leucine Rich repeats (2 copies) [Symmachiella dynata]|uniref:Leucine Rich repeats (2 copies) n=1 Tax=Symmachiella dynata TaxID=2527995 RepID=A0A517ZYG4_9PLAN|nr:hypothetical protein [Symmachiella dynata]QDU47522.1 Leucine Rich repeats (2 copies) [Symmachiella dynata]
MGRRRRFERPAVLVLFAIVVVTLVFYDSRRQKATTALSTKIDRFDNETWIINVGLFYESWGSSIEDRQFEESDLSELQPLINDVPSFRFLGLASLSMSDSACEVIAKMTALEQIDLSNTQITSAGIQALTVLPNLQYLNIAQTSVNDLAVESLISMRSLRTIDLQGAQLTKAGIMRLNKSRPDIKIIDR